MVNIDYPKIIGIGFFIYIIIFLFYKLYISMRKIRGEVPLIDLFLLKIFKKKDMEVNKNGIYDEKKNRRRNGEGQSTTRVGGDSEEKGKTFRGSSKGRDGEDIKERIFNTSTERSSNSNQRDSGYFRKYESIFK